MQYRLIVDKARSSFENMALDEAILLATSDGVVPPTLRLYTWLPRGLSLGHFQSIKTVRPDQCRSLGVDLVRRSTGGHAILHENELTYSFSGRIDDLNVGTGILESCEMIGQGLLNGLAQLGIQVESKGNRPKEIAALESADSPACFETAGRYEITCRGKKLVGSAQTRRRHTLLQHGSIPIRQNIDLLFELLAFSNEEERFRHKSLFTERATDINKEVGIVTVREVASAIVSGFKQVFAGEWQTGNYYNRELELLESLAAKYSSDDWNNAV